MSDKQGALSSKVIKGAAWIGAGRLGVRLIGVISTLILARLLTPEDFGLVAVAMAFFAILSQISEFGFNQALIRFQNPDQADYATAWTLNSLRGLLLALFLAAIAWPIAALYGDPRFGPLMMALAVIPLLQGVENVRFIDFEKRMDFRPVSVVMVIVKVLTFIVTITMALATGSYWALIIGNIAAQVFRLGLTYWAVPFRPWWTLVSWRKLMGFSGWLLGANVIKGFNLRSDEPILQMMVTTQAVGVFYLAKDLVLIPLGELTAPIQRALFPGLSQLEPGSARFRDAYLATVSGVMMIAAPVGAGIALVAEQAVPLVLGEQWLAAIVPMQLLAINAAINPLGRIAPSTSLASGRTRLLFNRGVIMLPIRLGGLITGAYYWGLPGAAAGLLAAGIIGVFINMSMASNVANASIASHFQVCWRTLVSVPIMALAVIVQEWVLAGVADGRFIYELLGLFASIITGAITYCVIHLLLWVVSGKPLGPESRLLKIVRKNFVRPLRLFSL